MQFPSIRFDRNEISGSLGDLGTLLPIAMGLIMLNGLSPVGIFWGVGLYYLLAGLYFRVPVAVQPMKTIGAYALAVGASAMEVHAAGLLIAGILLIVAVTNLIRPLHALIDKAVVRGVQVSTGTLLTVKGLEFIVGVSGFQKMNNAAEPFLASFSLGPISLSLLIGVPFAFLTFALLGSKRIPPGLPVILGGALLGFVLGGYTELSGIKPGLYFPELLPFGLPNPEILLVALTAMTLPQTPMTLGNAVFANADLSWEYFPESAQTVTPRSLCMSMGLANLIGFFIGAMPMCHGAGGLAAHYRFGARTAGSNLIIGALFLVSALVLGPHILKLLHLLPMAVLGVLLLFAGTQLCLTMIDLRERRELFIVFVMLALTLAFNLAWAFVVGIIAGLIFKRFRLAV